MEKKQGRDGRELFAPDYFGWETEEDHPEIAQCSVCKNFIPKSTSCAAFPSGIPLDVLNNSLDHRREIKDDNGVRWEPRRKDSRHPFDREA